ncbi:hypothetical protein [Paenibacillus tengchongensis]|uniref:hypothetical protein n=1 Tax=Paenibacillus tengchongensis TaxID=2608684 RepID=UPI00124DF07D|nr:hypothetical protein [Paenibacillus tengchongensis]
MFKHNPDVHGIKLKDWHERNTTDSAIASLRIALKSYFETYSVIHRYSMSLTQPFEGNNRKWELNAAEDLEYQEKYMQTIFHFHHFIELVTKDVLRMENPLYAMKINTDDLETIKKIQTGEQLEDTTHSIEFTSAIKRVTSLKGIDPPLSLTELFNKEGVKKNSLDVLNQLRNQAWHRGIYVLTYSELDQFIIGNILPLVYEIINTTQYKGILDLIFLYKKPLFGELDIIQSLVRLSGEEDINYSKIAFYKAVGLVCLNYRKPHRTTRLHGVISTIKAEAMVSGSFHNADERRKCMVCGEESLILFKEGDYAPDEDDGEITEWEYIYKAECQECGLLLYNDVGEPESYGVKSPKLWSEWSRTYSL